MNDRTYLSDLSRIAAKLNELGGLLNPPLTDDDVDEFEREYDVMLPADYRAFITRHGNGGFGPGVDLGAGLQQGLFPLYGDPPVTASGPIWCAVVPPLGRTPQKPTVFSGHYRPLSGAVRRACRPTIVGRLLSKPERALIACIFLTDFGGGDCTLLCVEGPHRGSVLLSQGEDVLLSHSGHDAFLSWYEAWLDKK